jgi:hypothetical protein
VEERKKEKELSRLLCPGAFCRWRKGKEAGAEGAEAEGGRGWFFYSGEEGFIDTKLRRV